MNTSSATIDTKREASSVTATGVHVSDHILRVSLSDGREISVRTDQISWLRWLDRATEQQQANWEIEPGGYAIYWEELDDGVEVSHLLDMRPMST